MNEDLYMIMVYDYIPILTIFMTFYIFFMFD